MNKYIIGISFLFFIILFMAVPGFAQGPDPGCDPLDPSCPIDGGLSILLAVGVGLGAKRTLKNK